VKVLGVDLHPFLVHARITDNVGRVKPAGSEAEKDVEHVFVVTTTPAVAPLRLLHLPHHLMIPIPVEGITTAGQVSVVIMQEGVFKE